MDYRIHGADEFILVSEMEETVLIYMEAIKNLLAIQFIRWQYVPYKKLI